MVRGFVDVDVERESEGIKSDPLTRPGTNKNAIPMHDATVNTGLSTSLAPRGSFDGALRWCPWVLYLVRTYKQVP